MPIHDLYDQFFEPATAVEAEGARIGIATCVICGAAVMLDPRDKKNRARQHYEWHKETDLARNGTT